MITVVLAAPEMELVTERDPVLLNNDGQSFYSPEVRIDHLLRKCAKLSCSIPTVRAMHQHVHSLLHQAINNHVHSLQNARQHDHVV